LITNDVIRSLPREAQGKFGEFSLLSRTEMERRGFLEQKSEELRLGFKKLYSNKKLAFKGNFCNYSPKKRKAYKYLPITIDIF